MGRAMLIICAGLLISMGFISMNTSSTGKMLTQQNVNYAEYTMAKNAAHTAIQIAMQKINQDEEWPKQHDSSSPWITTVQDLEVRLHTEFEENDFWETGQHDLLWFYSRAQLGEAFGNRYVEVRSHYLKRPFYELVPEFAGALQLPTDIGDFNVDGTAHNVSGIPPESSECAVDDTKPPLVVNSEETKAKVDSAGVNMDGGEIEVDPELNYEPTDELIERLYNSGGVTRVGSNYSGNLGTADNPGIFFIQGDVKLTGQQSQGFGIMVIRGGGNLEYEGEDGSTLEVAGNFEFNGLIIFENAFDFDGRGTPTVNGSVLVGNTEEYLENGGEPINIDLGGNININYDCLGEKYAKQAAAAAVNQNKYTQLTTTENIRY